MTDPHAIVLYAAVVATSGVALLAGARAAGRRWTGLGRAVRILLDVTGLTVVFLAANIVAGTAVVMGLRLAGIFVSLYAMDDLVLALLSAGQAFVFHAWRMR